MQKRLTSLANQFKRIFFKNRTKRKVLVSYREKRNVIDFYRKKYAIDYLVETGTFLGDTIQYFKKVFEHLYSIELSNDLANRAGRRFSKDANVTIVQGDSAEVLAGICEGLNGRALFWLDGHYSSEFYHKGEYIITAKSDRNTPVEKEIDILLQSSFPNIILIDDARLFTGEHDYPTIEIITKKVKSSGRDFFVFVESDIIHIIPQS